MDLAGQARRLGQWRSERRSRWHTAASLVSSDGITSPPAWVPLSARLCNITANRVLGIRVPIYKEGDPGSQAHPSLIYAQASDHSIPPQIYPSLCGRHLNAPRQTGSLHRSRYQRCIFPGYAEPARTTPNSLSHLLDLLPSISSATNHPQLPSLLLCPAATRWGLRYDSTRSSRGIVRRSDPTVVLRRNRGPFPATGSRSAPTQDGRVVLQVFPSLGAAVSVDGTPGLSSAFRPIAPGGAGDVPSHELYRPLLGPAPVVHSCGGRDAR